MYQNITNREVKPEEVTIASDWKNDSLKIMIDGKTICAINIKEDELPPVLPLRAIVRLPGQWIYVVDGNFNIWVQEFRYELLVKWSAQNLLDRLSWEKDRGFSRGILKKILANKPAERFKYEEQVFMHGDFLCAVHSYGLRYYGYIAIPPQHEFFGKNLEDFKFWKKMREECEEIEYSGSSIENAFDFVPGITFSGMAGTVNGDELLDLFIGGPGKPEGHWIIGFKSEFTRLVKNAPSHHGTKQKLSYCAKEQIKIVLAEMQKEAAMKNSGKKRNAKKSCAEKSSLNFYEILGVARNATAEDIKRAFKIKAFELHPDRNRKENAHVDFLAVNEAYQTLCNPEKRREYNRDINNKTGRPRESRTETEKDEDREITIVIFKKCRLCDRLEEERVKTDPKNADKVHSRFYTCPRCQTNSEITYHLLAFGFVDTKKLSTEAREYFRKHIHPYYRP